MEKRVYILAHERTPIGGFGGSLSSVNAVDLAIHASRALLADLPRELHTEISEMYFGNVLSANLGQAPARQIALGAGLPYHTEATTVNKVCSSGMKALTLAASSMLLGKSKLSLAGGTESMSNVPYYHVTARFGNKLGHQSLVDGLLQDGLWDAYHDFHMGNAAEETNRELQISRTEQDEIAMRSYRLTMEAIEEGYIDSEIVPMEVKDSKGRTTIVNVDEDPFKIDYEKVPRLKASFEKDGTITPANASSINDGAAAILLAEETFAKANNLRALAEIIDFADAAQQPEYFSTSPSLAIQKLLQQNRMKESDIDFFEINEAYASVVIANSRLAGIAMDKINIWGGAVALGHPIGMSGARIVGRLINILHAKDKELGIAAICNGGGGASAVLIRRL